MSQSIFSSRFSTENAKDSELIDENGTQPCLSELDGGKNGGKGGYTKETVVAASSFGVTASMLQQNPTKASLLMKRDLCG